MSIVDYFMLCLHEDQWPAPEAGEDVLAKFIEDEAESRSPVLGEYDESLISLMESDAV